MTTTVLQNLDIFKIKGIFQSFWVWWIGELKDLLPTQIVEIFSRNKTILNIEYGPKELQLKFQVGAGPQNIIKILPNATTDITKVFLDKTLVFKKEITLSLAHKKSLKQILPLQLDRHFPVAGKNVYFAFQTGLENEGKHTLAVTLYVLKPGITNRVFSYMKEAKLTSKQVLFFCRDGAKEIPFEIPVPKTIKAKFLLRNLIKNPLLISAGFWLLVFFAYPVYLHIQTTQLQEKVDEIQVSFSGSAGAVAEFEAQIQKETYLATYLEGPNILTILNGLAKALPQEAWVEDFSFKNDNIILNGFHPDPPVIIPMLEKSPWFQDVQLPSVTENPNAPESDRFRITMTVDTTGEGQQ